MAKINVILSKKITSISHFSGGNDKIPLTLQSIVVVSVKFPSSINFRMIK
jgi:hypothetical protein